MHEVSPFYPYLKYFLFIQFFWNLFLFYNLIKRILEKENFGPLHRYSCFPFEGYFSIMKKYISGTRGFVNQINNNHTTIGNITSITIGNIPSILEEKDSIII